MTRPTYEMLEDLMNVVCGCALGAGITRTTFVLMPDPTKVIKIERDDGSYYQNIMEWKVWDYAQGTALAPYLAPCRWISPRGHILIQDRVMPLPSAIEAKVGGSAILKDVMLPAILTDLKPENYGLLHRKIVACDYGTCLAINHGAAASKLRRVKLS